MDRRTVVPACLGLLVVLLGLTFGPHLAGQWVWDDVYLVKDDANVHGGASGLFALLSHDLWGSAGRPSSELYHPVPMALMWLVARGGGESVVPFRVVNVVLHAACVVLFAAWLERRRMPARGAAFASLLFAVHPLVTEPVMWITGCHDTLATLGCLVALCVWPRDRDAERRDSVFWRVVAASVATAWAALCKEPYFVLPALLAVIVLVDGVADGVADGAGEGTRPLRVASGAWFRRIAPLGGPIAAVGTVVLIRHRLGIPTGSARLHATVQALLVDYATVVAHYLKRSLTFDGGITAEAYHPLAMAPAALVLVGILSVTGFLVSRLLRRAPGADVAVIGWAWFGIALAPHAVATPSIGMFGNRYAYFPMMGLASVLLALGLPLFLSADVRFSRMLGFIAPVVPFVVVPFTAVQASYWRDEITLFGADLERNPDDARALYHYAHAVRVESGCAAALPFFVRSERNEPAFARAWHNVAGCLVDVHRYEEALRPAEVAYGLQPGDAGAAFNLAVARFGTGDAVGARALLLEAVRLDPHHAGASRLLDRMSGAAGSTPP